MSAPHFRFSCLLLLLFFACNTSKEKEVSRSSPAAPADTIKRAFIPVTTFIRGQLSEMSKAPITPLRILSKGARIDSTWIKNFEIAQYANPFLEPEIDSVRMAPFYSERSFLDQTLDAFTFTYEPTKQLPDSFSLQTWDVYINPQTSEIQRVFMVKKIMRNGQQVTQQLTWKSSSYFKIVNIIEMPGTTPRIEEEQVIWDFKE